MRTPHGKLVALAMVASFGCGVGLDGEDPIDPNVAPRQGAISGGQLETGYPMVGAILATAPGAAESHLCTGTIISDSWVLTAQHCEGTGMVFRRGNSIWSGYVEHAVDQQVRHPRLDQMLIHLATPLSGVPVLKINEGAAPIVGTLCTGVGFGENTAPGAPTGNGIKRSGTMTIQFVETETLTVKAASGLSGGGDSGGPLICNGVVAGTVKGHNKLDGDYPTRTTSLYKPVDATWIMSTIAPAFNELNLLNGWTQYGTRNASYGLVAGRVHLKGAISTTGTNAVAFSLPGGFRPDQNVTVPVDLNGGAKGSLLINKNGQVTVKSAGAFSVAASFTSLEGVSFVPSLWSYTNLVLKNGWVGGTGTSSPSAAKIGGIVRFRGAMQTTGTNMEAFTLPADLKPANNLYLPIALNNGKKGRLSISSGGVATVVPETTAVTADAQAMTSLDGAWFSPDATGFSNLGLQNGWATFGFGTATPAARLMNGVVHFRGALKSGTSSLAFTLPAALRPPVDVYVPVDVNVGHKGRLWISPTGTVNIYSETSSDAVAFTSLEGVSFTLSDFTPLVLESGWSRAGYGVAQPGFSLTNGIVQLKGAISGGVNGALFTLPVNARPPNTVYLPTTMCSGWLGRIIITSNGVATMYPHLGDLAKAQCFTGLDGLSFNASVLNHTLISLQNGWTNYGNGTRGPGFRNDNGVIRLHGAISTTSTNSNSLVATLPAAVRPPATVYQRVDLVNGKKGRVTIATDGSVYISAADVWRDAQSFTSLEGVTYSLSTGWAMTPQNGWVNYGTRPAAAVSAYGIVRLQGAVSSGTNSILFTLPPSLRPLKTAYVATDLYGGTNGRLFISTDGSVSVETASGPFSNATGFTSLEGVSFSLLGN